MTSRRQFLTRGLSLLAALPLVGGIGRRRRRRASSAPPSLPLSPAAPEGAYVTSKGAYMIGSQVHDCIDLMGGIYPTEHAALEEIKLLIRCDLRAYGSRNAVLYIQRSSSPLMKHLSITGYIGPAQSVTYVIVPVEEAFSLRWGQKYQPKLVGRS